MIRYKGFSTLEVLKEAKNYNRWIASQILIHLTSPILEIGAGTGNLTSFFLEKAPLHVSDSDKGLVKQLRKKFSGEKGITVSAFDATGVAPQEFRNYFSTIFGINVLEHIKDDTKALRTLHSLLRKNGKLVLLVPAKQSAYTQLDKELGHFRRYERQELVTKLQETGYIVEKIYFFNIVGLASWWFRDKVARHKTRIKPYHVSTFDKIVPFLSIMERYIKVPAGISLIVIARKRQTRTQP